MKPDKVICQNCGKQIPKGKWCSDKCRMANKRHEQPEQNSNPNTNKPEHFEPEHTNPNKDEFRATLTKTDKTFYDRAMREFKEPYYKFGDKLKEVSCLRCRDKFKTSLSMLRFCSYEHYSDSLSGKKD